MRNADGPYFFGDCFLSLNSGNLLKASVTIAKHSYSCLATSPRLRSYGLNHLLSPAACIAGRQTAHDQWKSGSYTVIVAQGRRQSAVRGINRFLEYLTGPSVKAGDSPSMRIRFTAMTKSSESERATNRLVEIKAEQLTHTVYPSCCFSKVWRSAAAGCVGHERGHNNVATWPPSITMLCPVI